MLEPMDTSAARPAALSLLSVCTREIYVPRAFGSVLPLNSMTTLDPAATVPMRQSGSGVRERVQLCCDARDIEVESGERHLFDKMPVTFTLNRIRSFA
jgi:hypothetical protein